MLSTKWLLFTSLVAYMADYTSAGPITRHYYPVLESLNYYQVPLEDGYFLNYNLPNLSIRGESVKILNASTDEEELIRKGSYIVYDPKYKLRSNVDYTADKNGYRAHYEIFQQEGFAKSPIVLKSLVG